ncbi:MAG: maltose alpha-D-glucosyltransferase [Deltaproteobacteria bacterium]
MRRPGSATDPLWYKDAIIYELHVRAFFDSNNDGIGDFAGLLQKLDYLADLGVTCIWLLPFFPSPLRDDGYDIADYLGVHPNYGTLDDFQAFLQAAHDRGLQVVIELVLNHTSDQHPWFQRAREAPPGSPERDFYVWSDSDEKYRNVRIIFTDTEKSNWTWDPTAKAYYWHRFFSHQPDLNFDNPLVVEEVLNVLRFWLDMGVDGVRLDAIPYLVEREGTTCENLPETHALIRRIRRAMDAYPNRMILAEANQWPTDVRPYFGAGDECHMAFHFPLMPRIFMALRLEDRFPIVDIMAQTPPIPDVCQWALFLRNHDELTLEMVTADERDYMYLAYSADPRMRLNLGIRRRLAPLLDHNQRRIELLDSLLLSFPGTPVIYYGDEIGMGDNIYLGDRNGVRTPMHWNGDRNAGFSRATPGRLYSPVIMDPIYGYEAVNVEAQQADSSSLLNWTRNMIALRKLFRVFGRGTLEFLHAANRKVLAYVRRFESETVLCVANLSRFAQPMELDLSAYEGMMPVEMLGYVEFPLIRREPYPLTLGPYAFMWFELHGESQAVAARTSQTLETETPLDVSGGWEGLLEGFGREQLETRVLPRFLPTQRWFGGKTHHLVETTVVDWGPLGDSGAALCVVRVVYEQAEPELYVMPLATSFGAAADALLAAAPALVMCAVGVGRRAGILHDATADDAASVALLEWIAGARQQATRHGMIRGVPGAGLAAIRGPVETPLPPRRGAAEQSNTSILFGDRLILKLFRRYQRGPNPECEIDRFLTDRAGFAHVPPFAGSLEYEENGSTGTLAVLQGLVASEGDGWTGALEELNRYYEASATRTFPTATPDPREYVGIYLDAAATLGRRTAELHVALAGAPDDPAFAPEPLSDEALGRLAGDLHDRAARAFERLKDNLPRLPDEAVEEAALVLRRRRDLLSTLGQRPAGVGGACIRIHGDYHLGQVLRVKGDYVILDFEGEPARSLAERQEKQSPLKDVAGMLRSFSYAAYTGLLGYTARRPEESGRLEPWARLWETSTGGAFLTAYRETMAEAGLLPGSEEGIAWLLRAYLLDKALYELLYELHNRPGWVRIPLWGLLSL